MQPLEQTLNTQFLEEKNTKNRYAFPIQNNYNKCWLPLLEEEFVEE